MKKITRLASVTPWVTHDFQKIGFLLTVTFWSCFSVWVSSPHSERAAVPQPRCPVLTAVACGAWWQGAGVINILAIPIRFCRHRRGREQGDTNTALQWFSRNTRSLWLVLGRFIGCALPAQFVAYLARGTRTPPLWNLISFFSSVFLRQTCSRVNLQTNVTAVLVPVFQYPETQWKMVWRSLHFRRGLGFLYTQA